MNQRNVYKQEEAGEKVAKESVSSLRVVDGLGWLHHVRNLAGN